MGGSPLTVVLIIVGFIMALAGLIGCIFHIIPGPPLSFLALIILSLAKNWEPFSQTFLIVAGVLTVIVTGLDYLFSAIGAKRHGASKLGLWGSVAGMLAGILFFPPWGMLLGAMAGALVGELF